LEIRQGTDALLLIDLQPDFMPGGALAVAEGDQILPLVNELAGRFEHVLLTQDWHPEGHISFASRHGRANYERISVVYGEQTLWPDHCLIDTPGAQIHSGVAIPHVELVLRKGFRREIDSYSAFLENDHVTPTGLAGYLRERGITRLFLAGLAYDFCVRFSAEDGTRAGFECVVIEDACRAVGLPGTVAATNDSFAGMGVMRVSSGQVGS